MSELQKENAAAAVMGSRYLLVEKVFGEMPNRFKLLDLLEKAGIKDGPNSRMAVGAILQRDFKCTNVGMGVNRVWKKP